MRGSVVAVFLLGCGRIGYDDVPDAAPDADTDGPPPCVAPYTQTPDGCFRVSTTFMTWLDAELDCEADGGHLATVDTVAEHFTLHDLAAGAAVAETWLGISDRVTEGTFLWVTNSGLDPLTDECFYGPSGPTNDTTLDCTVQLAQTQCGDWFLRDCTLTRAFICERDGNPPNPAHY